MTSLSINTVKHIGNLADLPLTEEEVAKFSAELSDTINYINDLSKVNTQGVEPTYQTNGKINAFREDEARPSLSQDEALKNAKSYNGFFISKVTWE